MLTARSGYKILNLVAIRKLEFSTSSSGTRNSKELFRYLLGQCDKLPKGPKEYYKFMIKQSFKQHVKESDPNRIEQIIKRSYEDAEWLLKKYLDKTK